MKTKLVLIAVACLLLGLTTSAVAQNNVPVNSPAMQQLQRDSLKAVWSGDGLSFIVLGMLRQEDEVREGIGISIEHIQGVHDTMQKMNIAFLQNDPSAKSIQEEFQKEMFAFIMERGNPFAEDAPEELRQTFSELQTRMQMAMQEILMEKQVSIMVQAVNENLTLEQLKRIREFQIATMSESPFVSPGMFEALELSDDQRKQLDEIKKAMEPEHEKHIDKMFEIMQKSDARFQTILDRKLEGVTDPEEQEKIRRETAEEFRRTDTEFRRERNEVMESGKELADTLKIRMFDVLTDVQWVRMLDLIDNPPEYAKKWIDRMRERREAETASAPTSGWVPGPGSWQPGDPIPMQYRQERETRGRFPRGEN